MNDVQLPTHVINRLERRWAARLARDAVAWRSEQSVRPRSGIIDQGGRRIPVTVKRGANLRRAEPAQQTL
jgi:hypothetical protein